MLQRSLPINFKHLGPTDLRKYTEWWRCYPPRTDERWRDMYHSFYPYLFHHSNDTLSLYPEINKNPRTWQPHQLQTVYDAVREDRYDAFLRIREKFPELYEDTHQWDKPPVFGEFNQFYTIRTGMVGMRVKYCREFDKFGNAYELTMIWVPDNQVVGHGRSSLHVGAMNVQPEFLEPNVLSYYVRSSVSPKQVRHKFRITPDSFVPIGTNLDVRHFRVGQEVSIRCMTFDYGFQGVVKRFGHDGGFAWMGESRWHRRPGSIGAQGAHRVWPGTALPGWMGGDARYFYHKPIYRIDYKNSLIYVVGKIPCDVGAYMTIEDTDHILGKTQWSLNRGYPPFPTFIPDPKEDLATMATDECQLVAPSLLGFMRDSAISTAQITQTDIEDASQVKQQVAAPKQEIYDYRKYRESKRKARKEYLADLRRRNKEKEPLRLQKQEEYRQAKARKYSKLK